MILRRLLSTSWVIVILFLTTKICFAQLAVADVPAETALITNLPAQLSALQAEVAQLQNFNWNSGNNQSEIQNLANYLQQAGNLAMSAQSVNNAFQTTYQGYTPPANFNQQYQQVISNTQNALKSVMQTMASINSQNDFMNQNSNLSSIESQVGAAQGSLQALQGLSQITAQLSSQLQMLQKTVAAQSSAQDAYYAQQMQNEASNVAGQQAMFSSGQTSAPPIGQSGESIHFAN